MTGIAAMLVAGLVILEGQRDGVPVGAPTGAVGEGIGSAPDIAQRGAGSRSQSTERSPLASPSSDDPAGASSGCGPFPSFPDESCSGWRHTGVTLRDCPNEITEDGATVDGCRFAGGLTVRAANVTVTRSRIEGMVWPRGDMQNLTLEDVEIDGTGQVDPGADDSQLAVGTSNYTCLRCHIHDTGRGVHLQNNVHIESSYIHDFPYMEGRHMSAGGSNGGSDITIIHNRFSCSVSGCSGALVFYGDFGPIEDVLVKNNLFNTTGSYCTYAGSVDGKEYPVATNVRYLDNHFGKQHHDTCGQYGPVAGWSGANGNQWAGNEWHDGSGPVEP